MKNSSSSPIRIPLSDPVFAGNEEQYILDCIRSTWISSAGPYVNSFEKAIAGYVKQTQAVSCVNGTAALHICLLLAGVKPGDEVIVPTLTFIAPINTVRYVNATPVFMDCDDYLNIDVEKLEAFFKQECSFKNGQLINNSTNNVIKAIIPVHIFGSICDMDRLMPLAQKYNLAVIEDATEALGSKMNTGKYKNQYAGAIADLGCYSFNGNKIITCGGGGMIVTSKEELANRARYLTTQAKNSGIDYIHDEVGYNYRLTALQAAVGLAQFEQLDHIIDVKKKNFDIYKQAIKNIKGLSLLPPPDYCDSNYWFYSLMIDSKQYDKSQQQLLTEFTEQNIQVRPIWQLNHLQKPYRNCQTYKIEKALHYQQRVLNLPCSVDLTEEDIERVVAIL